MELHSKPPLGIVAFEIGVVQTIHVVCELELGADLIAVRDADRAWQPSLQDLGAASERLIGGRLTVMIVPSSALVHFVSSWWM